VEFQGNKEQQGVVVQVEIFHILGRQNLSKDSIGTKQIPKLRQLMAAHAVINHFEVLPSLS
jgi:hypothetical protein